MKKRIVTMIFLWLKYLQRNNVKMHGKCLQKYSAFLAPDCKKCPSFSISGSIRMDVYLKLRFRVFPSKFHLSKTRVSAITLQVVFIKEYFFAQFLRICKNPQKWQKNVKASQLTIYIQFISCIEFRFKKKLISESQSITTIIKKIYIWLACQFALYKKVLKIFIMYTCIIV